MKYLIFILSFSLMISCQSKNEDIGYRIERIDYDNSSNHSIKLINKDNVEIVTINFNENGSMKAYMIRDENFYSIFNLDEGTILSYVIGDKQYMNSTVIDINYADSVSVISRFENLKNMYTYIQNLYGDGTTSIEVEKIDD
ncbi:MAG: hypothetical protein LBI28_09130 [Treponema sp.]|nr:hypothetical protein [Treponema sp.]